MRARPGTRWIWAAWAGLLAGCNPELGYGDGALVSCDVDADCIDGFVCVGTPSRCVPLAGLDVNGVALVAPALDASVADGRVTLAWRGVPGAASYVVEVTTDAAGLSPIPGSPFVVGDRQQTLTLEGLTQELTHYWRVTSDITLEDVEPQQWRFDVIGSVLHVFCPPERASCTPAEGEVQAGNLSRPFTRIQDGIDAAERLRRDAVHVAGRGIGFAYDESLAVSRGIALVGGYDPSFAARDALLHEVWVRDAVTAIAVSLADAPTLIEGMRFSAGAADTPIAIGVSVDNVRSPVTLRNCRIAATEASAVSIGVRLGSSLLPEALRLEDVSIDASGAPSVRGVVAREASLRLVGTRVTAAGAQPTEVIGVEVASALSQLDVSASTISVAGPEVAAGIQSAGAVASVDGTIVEVGLSQLPAPRFSNGLILAAGVQRAVLQGNRISVRGSNLSRGIQLFSVKAIVANNLVGAFGCPSGDSEGMRLRYYENSGLLVAHNTVAITSGGSGTYPFAMEFGARGVIRNNVTARLGTCATTSQGLTNLSALAQWTVVDNLVSSELPLGVTSSNTSLPQAGVDVFAAAAGPDADPASFADNDWRLGPLLAGYVGSAPALVQDCAALLTSVFGGPEVCDALASDAAGVARSGTSVTPGAFEGP